MSRFLASALLSFPLCLLLAGCGHEKREVTNEFYHPERPVASKTLYPKTETHPAKVQTENRSQMPSTAVHETLLPQSRTTTPSNKHDSVLKKPTPSHKNEIRKNADVSVQMKDRQTSSPQQSEKTAVPKVTYTLPVPPKPVEPIDVQKEIAKTLEAVERIKAEAAKEIAEALRVIKIVKPIRATKVMPVVPSVVDVVKAEAVAEVAEATAFAQTAEAVAKAKIAKAVAKVQISELNDATKPATKEAVRHAKAEAAKKIAKAVAAAEIAKAKAAATIARSVAEVEKQKAKKYPSLAEKLFGEK